MDGKPVPFDKSPRPAQNFVYHGFYRHGPRVIFAYRIGDVEYLDSPWVEQGKFVRTVAPVDKHPLAKSLGKGPLQWPQVLETRCRLGRESPYAVDNIGIPFENPWRALMFISGHDFLDDGTAFVCTMQGDVWKVTGLDAGLEHVKWRRFASGLSHALGLVISDSKIFVVGRDQITRLHDLNQDSEADFYECVSNAYATSPAGHDFICGLERDPEGNFYTASGNQGLIKISPDGKDVEVLATGFRNPDGLALLADGSITVPCSEGEWTAASMGLHGAAALARNRPTARRRISVIPARKRTRSPHCPFCIPASRRRQLGRRPGCRQQRPLGPLKDQLIHTSNGTATHLPLMPETKSTDRPWRAAVPLVGDFSATIHRARFNPHDGQSACTRYAGWHAGAMSRTPASIASATRVRRCSFPVVFTSTRMASSSDSPDPSIARSASANRPLSSRAGVELSLLAAYGSPEFSPRHRGIPGHDPQEITSIHVLPGELEVFLEMPDLQPVNQLHLHLQVTMMAFCCMICL